MTVNNAKETLQRQPESVPGNADLWATKATGAKDINKTLGGRLTNWGIDWGLGFFGNAGLSVYTTYYLNPKPAIKSFKDKVQDGIQKTFKATESAENIRSGIRSGIEICFMFAAGTVATLVMTPLVSRREKIAHGINNLLGRDKDVLPADHIALPQPQTEEEHIRQEIEKRVNRKQTAGDLWKARIPAMFAIFGGDQLYNWANIKLEKNNITSPDTLILRGGQQLYKAFPETAEKANRWFENHEAGMADVKQNAAGHYKRLEAVETKYGGSTPDTLNTSRMAVAEGTRLFAKEVGWTFTMADAVKRGTQHFQYKRIRNETQKAITTLQKNGMIPEGYRVELNPKGELIISPPSMPEMKATSPETPEHFVRTMTDAAPSPRLDLKEQNWTRDPMQAEAPQRGATIH